MSNILAAIHDDIEDYRRLCGHHKEPLQYMKDAYGNLHPACYGAHAKELEQRTARDKEGLND